MSMRSLGCCHGWGSPGCPWGPLGVPKGLWVPPWLGVRWVSLQGALGVCGVPWVPPMAEDPLGAPKHPPQLGVPRVSVRSYGFFRGPMGAPRVPWASRECPPCLWVPWVS